MPILCFILIGCKRTRRGDTYICGLSDCIVAIGKEARKRIAKA